MRPSTETGDDLIAALARAECTGSAYQGRRLSRCAATLTDLEDLLRRTVTDHQPFAAQKGISLVAHGSADLPTLEADAAALGRGVAGPIFAAYVDDPATLAAVAAESAEAEALGIEPPAVVIDGRVFGGVKGDARLRAVARRAHRAAMRRPSP